MANKLKMKAIIVSHTLWGEISVIITLYYCKFGAEIISRLSVNLGMAFRYFGYTLHKYSGMQFLFWCIYIQLLFWYAILILVYIQL